MILKTGLKWVAWVAAVGLAVATVERPSASPAPQQGARQLCDPAWTALFTPRTSRLGHYSVCDDPRPLAEVAPPAVTIEALEPLDAFGTAGAYDRARLAQVYGGTRARVVRAWSRSAQGFESITLIAPHPDVSLTHLEPGTLVIRWFCDCGL